MNYVKSTISQTDIKKVLGDIQVDVVYPITARQFEEKDWYMNDCQKIESAILKSGNGWVTFMHELVSHLFLNGQDI